MTDLVKEIFGSTLRNQRRKINCTQNEIALRCDMSLRFYQDLEAGNKLASIATLFRLAKAMETTPNDLLTPAYREWKKTG